MINKPKSFTPTSSLVSLTPITPACLPSPRPTKSRWWQSQVWLHRCYLVNLHCLMKAYLWKHALPPKATAPHDESSRETQTLLNVFNQEQGRSFFKNHLADVLNRTQDYPPQNPHGQQPKKIYVVSTKVMSPKNTRTPPTMTNTMLEITTPPREDKTVITDYPTMDRLLRGKKSVGPPQEAQITSTQLVKASETTDDVTPELQATQTSQRNLRTGPDFDVKNNSSPPPSYRSEARDPRHTRHCPGNPRCGGPDLYQIRRPTKHQNLTRC